MKLLGIETSCDETSASVVDENLQVHSNVVYTQIAKHKPYGGVVPEIASRCHVEVLAPVIEQALEEAQCTFEDLDGIAVTRGPGLSSSLLVGVSSAKSLAMRLGLPLYGVNHLHGHLYSLFLGEGAPALEAFGSILILLVSGGHTMLVMLEADGSVELLGQTIDDAAGEALDKGATLLRLGYPGGPLIEKAAQSGRPDHIPFPSRPRLKDARRTGGLNPEFCFSFSGLKTSLLYHMKKHPEHAGGPALADVCASYQEAAFSTLIDRAEKVMQDRRVDAFACVGGVAKNQRLRSLLEETAAKCRVPLLLARLEFCTDNAAMIAAAAAARSGLEKDPLRPCEDPAALDVDPNWGL